MAANAEQQSKPDPTKTGTDPAEQRQVGDQEDVTSGSEGGGPRVGYSEPEQPDRLKFPQPKAPQPREGQ